MRLKSKERILCTTEIFSIFPSFSETEHGAVGFHRGKRTSPGAASGFHPNSSFGTTTGRFDR